MSYAEINRQKTKKRQRQQPKPLVKEKQEKKPLIIVRYVHKKEAANSPTYEGPVQEILQSLHNLSMKHMDSIVDLEDQEEIYTPRRISSLVAIREKRNDILKRSVSFCPQIKDLEKSPIKDLETSPIKDPEKDLEKSHEKSPIPKIKRIPRLAPIKAPTKSPIQKNPYLKRK